MEQSVIAPRGMRRFVAAMDARMLVAACAAAVAAATIGTADGMTAAHTRPVRFEVAILAAKTGRPLAVLHANSYR